MPNLRIIYNNVADTATVTVTNTAGEANTAGTLVAANMQNDYKGKVHRSTTTNAVYTLSWAANQTIRGIALPCTNLSSSATIRVQLYSDAGATIQIADSGIVNAGASLPEVWNQTTINANTFAYGGYSKTAVWFTTQYTTVRSCKITLTNSTTIDCSRLVVGDYWEPTYNAENGVDLQLIDTSQLSRSESGDLVVDRDIIYENLKFNFALLAEADRAQLNKIIKLAGTSKNILVCLFPGDANTQQDFMVYGKRNNSSIINRLFSFYDHSMEITGW